MILWIILGVKNKRALTFDEGFFEPALDAGFLLTGFSDILEDGLTDALEVGLAAAAVLEGGFAEALEGGLAAAAAFEGGFEPALDAGLAWRGRWGQ